MRRDLGGHDDQAVIREFLDRVGSGIDDRVDARVEARISAAARASAASRAGRARRPSIALGIVSIVSGIPITAIVLSLSRASVGGMIVLVVVWAAIVAVNLVDTRQR